MDDFELKEVLKKGAKAAKSAHTARSVTVTAASLAGGAVAAPVLVVVGGVAALWSWLSD